MLDKLPDEIEQLILNAYKRTQELQPSFEDHPDAFCFIQTATGDWFKNIITSDVLKFKDNGKTVISMAIEGWKCIGSGPVIEENYIKNPTPPQKKTTAHSTLAQAQAEMQDRATTYDSAQGERSMAATVAMFNTLKGTSLTEVDGWQFMEILKMVRSNQGNYKWDNYVDGASYAALAAEAHAATCKK